MLGNSLEEGKAQSFAASVVTAEEKAGICEYLEKLERSI
jgi:hypothetical protein